MDNEKMFFEKSCLKKQLIDIENYVHVEDDLLDIYYLGTIVYTLNNTIITDVLKIGHLLMSDKLDFNTLYGYYKIVIYDKKRDLYFFWGDNVGSQVFFIDDDNQIFSDSFLKIRSLRNGNLEPNYAAIQLLLKGFAFFDRQTILNGVSITDSEYYYIYSDNTINAIGKGLSSFTDNEGKELKEVMKILLAGIEGKEIAAVCTGGTDSRVVLAHLMSFGKKPQLIITGYDDNPDVKVAKNISSCLNCQLTIQNPGDKSDNWLRSAFVFSDGIYDTVLSYRHYKKLLWAKGKKIQYEFGGVGGEFYKNYYYKPFLGKVIGKKPSVSLIYNQIFSTIEQPFVWGGEKINNECRNQRKRLETIIEKKIEHNLFQSLNRVGLQLLQGKSCSITNNMASGCIKIDPLLERDVISKASHKLPLSLVMNLWHRREIANSYPKLADIETDQGYSCSIKVTRYVKDTIKKLMFYASRVFARLLKSFGMKYTSSEFHYWDKDYMNAKTTDIYKQALKKCEELEIVKENIGEEIPITKVGEIIQIGLFFSD